MDFRCPERLHLRLDDDVIEVKCRSKRCGAGAGKVVLHKFNAHTGELISTLRFKDPRVMFSGGGNPDSANRHADREGTKV